MADERAESQRADDASDAPAESERDPDADDEDEAEEGRFDKVVDVVLALADLV